LHLRAGHGGERNRLDAQGDEVRNVKPSCDTYGSEKINPAGLTFFRMVQRFAQKKKQKKTSDA